LLPSNRTLLIGAGAVLAGVVVLALLSRYGKQAGLAVGRGAGNFAGNAVAGAALGIGDAVGLPDTTDAQTVAEGRAALARGGLGGYLEASAKLPAPEFFAGVAQKLKATTASSNDNIDATAGAGSITNGAVDAGPAGEYLFLTP
jgi:hypothetical protein